MKHFYQTHFAYIEARERGFINSPHKISELKADPLRYVGAVSKFYLKTMNMPAPVHIHPNVLTYEPHYEPSAYFYKLTDITIADSRLKKQYQQDMYGYRDCAFFTGKKPYREPVHEKIALKFSYKPYIFYGSPYSQQMQRKQLYPGDQKQFMRDLISPRRRGMFYDVYEVDRIVQSRHEQLRSQTELKYTYNHDIWAGYKRLLSASCAYRRSNCANLQLSDLDSNARRP